MTTLTEVIGKLMGVVEILEEIDDRLAAEHATEVGDDPRTAMVAAAWLAEMHGEPKTGAFSRPLPPGSYIVDKAPHLDVQETLTGRQAPLPETQFGVCRTCLQKDIPLDENGCLSKHEWPGRCSHCPGSHMMPQAPLPIEPTMLYIVPDHGVCRACNQKVLLDRNGFLHEHVYINHTCHGSGGRPDYLCPVVTTGG